jgi:DNA-binding cell septation regulator SpoVG
MTAPDIRLRTWLRASASDQREGLVGWISIEFGSLLIDGITLRRLAAGGYGLSFPRRTAKDGTRHSIVRPIDDDARRAIEAKVLGQLRERIAAGKEADDA